MNIANRRTRDCESANHVLRIGEGLARIVPIEPVRSYVDRNLVPRIREAMQDTPVVALQGARQVGKSTIAAQLAQRYGGRYVTLDDEPARNAANADPLSFVATDGLLVIDEVQRAPEIILAVKAAVDRDRRPGRYLLTGSADLLRLRSIQDSLAGRAETLELFGYSQGERNGIRDSFVDGLMSAGLPIGWSSTHDRAGYLEAACAGGYPEAVQRTGRRRAAWFDSYTRRIVERDARDLSGLQRLSDLGRLLELVAARNACELNLADLSTDAGFAARTLPAYLDLLEALYLIWRLPAWSTNLTSRVTGRPKLMIVDCGLAAYLANLSPASMHPTVHPEPAGGLLEAFVASELRRQLGWSEESVRMFHFRDRAGAEVDLVLEHADGRIAAIDVKSGSTIGLGAFKWLAMLRDRIGDRFVQGVVLYTGSSALGFGDRLSAQPISALWRKIPA